MGELNDGRTASILLNWLRPILEQVEIDILNSMKFAFRQGKWTESLLASHIAQLTAIDDLKTKIKGIAVRGERASEELSQELNVDENIDWSGDGRH